MYRGGWEATIGTIGGGTLGGGTLGGAGFVTRKACLVGYRCVGSRDVEYLNRADVGFELDVSHLRLRHWKAHPTLF